MMKRIGNGNGAHTPAQIGLAAALLCVLSPIALPLGEVSASALTLVIYIISLKLTSCRSAAAVAVYIIIGLAGIPVFSGFTGGFSHLLGPTGGFIVGYIPMAAVTGLGARRGSVAVGAVFAVLGTVLLYGVGTLWYSVYAGVGIAAAAAVCVIPFAALDAVKIAAALYIARRLGAFKAKAEIQSRAPARADEVR